MKAQSLLLLVPVVAAFRSTAPRHPFIGPGRSTGESSTHSVDIEGGAIGLLKLEASVKPRPLSPHVAIEEAEATRGMPWTASIDAALGEDALLYMPFWEWQLDFMKMHLTDLRVEPTTFEDIDFSFKENTDKKARIVNLNFSCREYRKIRMTYYDAGANTQVFNSVFYPAPEYNLPVLGIDLLAFNRKKYLAIVDFQPIHKVEADHAQRFEHILSPIKEKYESLKGRMSTKFYDETQFFSQQMLFARFEEEQIISKDLLPAFQQYVHTHLDLIKSTTPEPLLRYKVLERQQAYDTYSAERDPATGLFAAMFGKEWADGFVYDFLFSLSEKKEGGIPAFMPPGMGGAPMGGNPYANGGAPVRGNPYANGGAPQLVPAVASA